MTMKQHFPQYTLAVLLALTLVGCHGPEYNDEVYDSPETYEYDHEEGNTINGWTVSCSGPFILFHNSSALNDGTLLGDATLESYSGLGVYRATFYNGAALKIYANGNAHITDFSSATSFGLPGTSDVYVKAAGWVEASTMTNINLTALAENSDVLASEITGGILDLRGRNVTLGRIQNSDNVTIQASNQVTMNEGIESKKDLSVSRLVTQGTIYPTPAITIGDILIAEGKISMFGTNVTGKNPYAYFSARSFEIVAADTVDIQQRFVGGDELQVTANKDVQLGSLQGISGSTVLTSAEGNVSFSSFLGTTLEATANKNVTATDSITAYGNVTLNGACVSTQSITANWLKLTSNDTSDKKGITISGDLTASGELESARDITITGKVEGTGNLLAQAQGTIAIAGPVSGGTVTLVGGNSFTVNSFTGGELAARSGDGLTINSFTGTSLSAKADGYVTLGAVTGCEASIEIEGSGISAKDIAAVVDVNLKSLNGGISISGDLAASGALESAGGITITGKVEGTGNLLAHAQGTIAIGGPISGGTVTLVGGNSFTVDSFTSGELVARSGNELTINSFTGTSLDAAAVGTLTLIDGTASTDAPETVKLSSGKHIIIGKTEDAVANNLTGNFDVTYTGDTNGVGYEVDVNGWVHGDFKATALTGGVNVGFISGNATVEAQQICLSALSGGNLVFYASDNVKLEGNVTVNNQLKIDAKEENGVWTRADITIDSSLATGANGTIELYGKVITGKAANQTVTADLINIQGSDTINIQQTLRGERVYADGFNGVTLGAVGDDVQPVVAHASILSSKGCVTLGSFTGITLMVTAHEALTVEGSIVSEGVDMWGDPGRIHLEGASVSTQAITADGTVELKSTKPDYVGQDGRDAASIAVGAASAGDSIKAFSLNANAFGSISVAGHLSTDQRATLKAGGDITFGDEAVVRGSLDATATGKVDMEGFFYDCEEITINAGGEMKLGMVGALGICEEEGGPVENHPVGNVYLSSVSGPVTIDCFAGRTINASSGGALTIGNSEDDVGIDSTGEGMWNADGTGSGPFAVCLEGYSISAQYITSKGAVSLHSTGMDTTDEYDEPLPSIEVKGNVSTNALQATAMESIALRGVVDIKGNGGPDSIIRAGGQVEFGDLLTVEEARFNIMNIAEASNLTTADVTIGTNATIGVYTGATAAEDQEGTLTIAGDYTLTAGVGALLNADLVMEEDSTLDVSAAGGVGGLQMGSTVTLDPGRVLLSDADMEAVGALEFEGMYDLFSGVDGLFLDGGFNFLEELGLTEPWVKAADVFANPEFDDEREYYLFYSGAAQGGAGERVGTVYLMQIPEPATGGLSLLALALLASRRKRR